MAEVSDADVDKTIEILRKQRVRYETVERPAQARRPRDDRFHRHASTASSFEGGQAKDFAIVLGEGRMLPEFEAALIGMKAGETKTFELTFPEDYHGKEVAGKTAEFDVTVKAVAEPQLPDVDAEFAKAFGVASGNVDELRAEVRANLEREVQAQDRWRASRSR